MNECVRASEWVSEWVCMGFALLINSTVVLVDPTIMPYQTACLLRQVSLSRPHSRLASCIFPLQRLTTLLLLLLLPLSIVAGQSIKGKNTRQRCCWYFFSISSGCYTHTHAHSLRDRHNQEQQTTINKSLFQRTGFSHAAPRTPTFYVALWFGFSRFSFEFSFYDKFPPRGLELCLVSHHFSNLSERASLSLYNCVSISVVLYE